jgi:hypothetical protein
MVLLMVADRTDPLLAMHCRKNLELPQRSSVFPVCVTGMRDTRFFLSNRRVVQIPGRSLHSEIQIAAFQKSPASKASITQFSGAKLVNSFGPPTTTANFADLWPRRTRFVLREPVRASQHRSHQ